LGKWGHFSADGKEYIITRPDTPRPWINYLTNGKYCAICSQTGGGYSFIGDPGYNRITREHPGDEIFEDRPGRYIFVHELETGNTWSLNWQPMLKQVDKFEARVGLGYTKISTSSRLLDSEITYFVPTDDNIEFWMVNLVNHSSHKRTFRLYTYNEWTLGDFHSDIIDRSFVNLFNKTWFAKNILFATKTRWTNPEGKIMPWDKVAFTTLNIPVDGYESMREKFLGEYQYLNSPKMVMDGVLPEHTGDSADAVGNLCVDITLDANESVDFDVICGAVEKEAEATKLRQKYLSHSSVEKALEQVHQYWEDYNNHLIVETPDASFNTSVNIWNRYQCWVTSQWSEMDSYYISGSGTYGFRDESQHIFGILPHDSELYRQKLTSLMTHQFNNGMTVHNWNTFNQKGEVTHHSDDPQWLAMAILNYINETGNLSFLSELVPYYDSGSGEVYDHLIKAIDYSLVRVSKRGISLRQTADWNDALGGSTDGRGESMMVANQICRNIQDLLPILLARHNQEAYDHYQKHFDRLNNALNKYAWDGRWYVRATCDNGQKIGSHTNEEGMIHLNGQTWPIMSGVADKIRGETAMDQVWKKLMTPFGPAIFLPPFTAKNADLGIIAQFTPGTKENGTIFLHPAAWSVIAESVLGRGDKAFEIWRRSSFITRSQDPKYKSEPYVYPEYMYGPAHPKFGQGSYTWITGSAAWFYRACTDWILGVRPTLEGLLILPAVPKSWKNWNVTRDFRGARYEISFIKSKNRHKRIKISVDGTEIDGNVVPDMADGKTHQVKVEI
jgi:cellobiose phosphorylase